MATLTEHHLAHLRHGLSLLAIGLAGKPIAPAAADAVSVAPAAQIARTGTARRGKVPPAPSKTAPNYFATLPWQDGARGAALAQADGDTLIGGQNILELGAAQAMQSASLAARPGTAPANGAPRSGNFFAALPWQQAAGQ